MEENNYAKENGSRGLEKTVLLKSRYRRKAGRGRVVKDVNNNNVLTSSLNNSDSDLVTGGNNQRGILKNAYTRVPHTSNISIADLCSDISDLKNELEKLDHAGTIRQQSDSFPNLIEDERSLPSRQSERDKENYGKDRIPPENTSDIMMEDKHNDYIVSYPPESEDKSAETESLINEATDLVVPSYSHPQSDITHARNVYDALNSSPTSLKQHSDKYSSVASLSSLRTPFRNVIRKISKHVYFDKIPKISSSSNDNRVYFPEGKNLDVKNDLYLYEEEMEEKMPATSIISSLNNYTASIPPNTNASFQGPANGDIAIKSQSLKVNKLGTVMGVFLPCIQNIFGVILFLRMNWIVGIAGAFQALLIILICCSVTLITAISMSAIATNGVVPAGGAYFMISRSLGPEFGGAVGFLFYLATTFATAMYTIGAVEILLVYLVPSIAIFSNMYHNFRVYGTCFLVVMTLIVMVGVKLVNKIAAISLFCVLLSILAIYVGIFAYFHGNPKVLICMIGDQLIKKSLYGDDSMCYKIDAYGKYNHKMWGGFCKRYDNVTSSFVGCSDYFINHNITQKMGIPGLGSKVFLDNMKSRYMKKGEANPGEPAISEYIVQAYLATSFTILLGIYFPSVTGIMAGSNRSGDLADAQNSIPKGTLAAIIFTSLVYISSALLFAASISSPLMRDKFGSSIGGGMIVANLGWPHPLIVTIGSFLSTIGAALQSLTGAPRLLQAIAKDNIVPFLKWFTKTSAKGEPLAALGLTFVISLLGIFIGNLDFIAPILTMFFLMCYGFVNLACALQTLLKTPNWRPRFKYYHWFLSLIGLALCVAAMFISSWYYALIAMGIACALYKYIEYYGAEKEWGDGVKGLQLSTALFSLLRYEQQQSLEKSNMSSGLQHTKNWRPQLLVLCKFEKTNGEGINKGKTVMTHPRMLSFAHQLKAGRGLTVCATAIQGDWTKDSQEAYIIKENLRRYMAEEKVKGFCDVVMTKDYYTGILDLVQLSGLGGLRHNAIMIAWPRNWKRINNGIPSWKMFVDVVRAASAGNMAIMVMKGCDKFPSKKDRIGPGTIDVWWIVHDGGLLMLIPFLLKQNKVWKNCVTRIFTVAQFEDNSVLLKKNLENFIYSLRIKAQVEIVEMHKSDISAYTYERTLLMEQRSQMLRQLNLSRKESLAVVQAFIDNAHEKPQGHSVSVINNNLAVPGVTNPSLFGGIKSEPDNTNTNSFADRPGRLSIIGNQNIFKADQPTTNDIEMDSNKKVAPEQSKGPDKDDVTISNNLDTNKRGTNHLNLLLPASNGHLTNAVKEDADNANNHATTAPGSPFRESRIAYNKIDAANVKRMHAAIKLNEAIVQRSKSASLVMLNMPGPPRNRKGDENFMEYLEVLTEKLDRVLLIRGSGQEVVTIYS
ncbi:unnamed protein product [Gordionus sp. m RMFG-2023]